MAPHHGEQGHEPDTAGGEARQQGVELQGAAHGAHMHAGVQGLHGPGKGRIRGHGLLAAAVAHEHHVLVGPAFFRQMGQHGPCGGPDVFVTGQQGRPDAHMQAVQASGLVRIGAHVGMFAAGDDLQGLHGHMGEIFQAQAAQGLEHGIVFLPGTCQTGAQQLRRKGPAHANAGKTFAHPGVELAQRATPLGAARTVGDQQDSCFHPCWCTSLAARWQDGGPHG